MSIKDSIPKAVQEEVFKASVETPDTKSATLKVEKSWRNGWGIFGSWSVAKGQRPSGTVGVVKKS
jgi:hypothetical protein